MKQTRLLLLPLLATGIVAVARAQDPLFDSIRPINDDYPRSLEFWEYGVEESGLKWGSEDFLLPVTRDTPCWMSSLDGLTLNREFPTIETPICGGSSAPFTFAMEGVADIYSGIQYVRNADPYYADLSNRPSMTWESHPVESANWQKYGLMVTTDVLSAQDFCVENKPGDIPDDWVWVYAYPPEGTMHCQAGSPNFVAGADVAGACVDNRCITADAASLTGYSMNGLLCGMEGAKLGVNFQCKYAVQDDGISPLVWDNDTFGSAWADYNFRYLNYSEEDAITQMKVGNLFGITWKYSPMVKMSLNCDKNRNKKNRDEPARLDSAMVVTVNGAVPHKKVLLMWSRHTGTEQGKNGGSGWPSKISPACQQKVGTESGLGSWKGPDGDNVMLERADSEGMVKFRTPLEDCDTYVYQVVVLPGKEDCIVSKTKSAADEYGHPLNAGRAKASGQTWRPGMRGGAGNRKNKGQTLNERHVAKSDGHLVRREAGDGTAENQWA